MFHCQYVLENYFYPIFIRLSSMPKRMRVFMSTCLAFFTGTLFYHLAIDGMSYLVVSSGNLSGLIPFMVCLLLFSLVIGLGLVPTGDRSKMGPLRLLIVWISFWLVYATVMLFRPILTSGNPWDNFAMFLKVFQR